MNDKPQKAKLPTEEKQNARNHFGKKELVASWNVVSCRKGEMREVITARCWMGRSRTATRVDASIWIHGDKFHSSGRGYASGGGYHKESAAICEAIESAGVKLEKDISGYGDGAINDALTAIAKAMGFRKVSIVRN